MSTLLSPGSTVPPSYQTYRSHSELPSYPATPRVSYEVLRGSQSPSGPAVPERERGGRLRGPRSRPSSLNRPRSWHHRPLRGPDPPPFRPTGPANQSAQRLHNAVTETDEPSAEERPAAHPRKAQDGGIRLAGGPLDGPPIVEDDSTNGSHSTSRGGDRDV